MNITITNALISLYPKAKWVIRDDVYSGIEWEDDSIPKPSEQELNTEVAKLKTQYALDTCKETAKQKIAATDWSVLPDVGLANVAAFETYRATLRELIKNPVAEPTWPTEPDPIWS